MLVQWHIWVVISNSAAFFTFNGTFFIKKYLKWRSAPEMAISTLVNCDQNNIDHEYFNTIDIGLNLFYFLCLLYDQSLFDPYFWHKSNEHSDNFIFLWCIEEAFCYIYFFVLHQFNDSATQAWSGISLRHNFVTFLKRLFSHFFVFFF